MGQANFHRRYVCLDLHEKAPSCFLMKSKFDFEFLNWNYFDSLLLFVLLLLFVFLLLFVLFLLLLWMVSLFL